MLLRPPNPDPDVVAATDYAGAWRNIADGHIIYLELLVGPNWNLWNTAYGCEGMRKVGAHENGHGFGVFHSDPGSNDLMQDGLGTSSVGAWDGFPNECEKAVAVEALTANLGNGGPTDPDFGCGNGTGVSDNNVCCNGISLFAAGVDNLRPTGHITTLNGTKYPTGGSGVLTIHADDLDGHVTRVGWYLNGILAYTSLSSPFSYPFSNAPAGVYTVQAAIYDSAPEDVYVWSTNTITVTVGNYYATDTLQTSEHLFPGYVLVAPNWGYYAQLQSNGAFNLYTAAGGLIGSTGTFGPPLYVRMNENGNVVLRHKPFNDVWQTYTGSWNNTESGLRVLDSGKMAVIRRTDGAIVWQYP